MKELGLSPLLSDGMIIQRDTEFPVWTSEKVTVTFLGKTYEAQQTGGKWLVTLDPVHAGGPFTMEIVYEEGSVTISDIYAGDLWLCAGQSNMEMMMERLYDDYGEEWEIKDWPLIRQFKVPQEWDFSAPHDDICGGSWLCASRETLHEFSGTAWFFAKKMYEKYRIPIGLINTAWGGTPVESWMSREALVQYPEKIAAAQQYIDTAFCEKLAKKNLSEITEWERDLRARDTGAIEKWQDPQTDITDWSEITLPGDFSEAGLSGFCGVIWLARDFEIAEKSFALDSAKIWLGTITDADTVYINGVRIGDTAYRYPPRKYQVNAGILKEGKNRIVIKVICNNGEGGFTREKPFRLFADNVTSGEAPQISVELKGVWKYKTGAVALLRPVEFFFQRQPIGNFNAMIAPVLKYSLKGVIWYQGESNDTNPHDYKELFQLMIKDWRKKNREDLPFLFVQLPVWKEMSDNNEEHPWAILREAQAAALSLPYTGMACALELGEWNDLHPVNKKDVGLRLFLAAEKTLFGIENTSPGPMLKHYEKKDEKLYIYFDNCGSGLILNAPDNKVYVSVLNNEGQTRVPAEIEGTDCISIAISYVENTKTGGHPAALLYAWANNPRDRQLFNSEKLPAIPFRIVI